MKDLPTVEKPYLTLDEAFNQLKKAGVELNKPEDILVIAENKELNVNLILELSSDIMIIDEKHVRALLKKIPASEYQYDTDGLLEEGFSSEDTNEFKQEITLAAWLDLSDDAVITEFDKPKCFTPKAVNNGVSNEELKITSSRSWLSDKPTFESLSALEIDEVKYLVVKDLTDNPLFPSVERTLEENGYEDVKYCLDETSIEAIIESNSYVVTREELLAYVERRRDRIKGIAQTKAGRKISTIDVFDLYNSPIADTVQKTNLLELDDFERYFQLYAWKAALEKEMLNIRKKDYQYEEYRIKDITEIKSSLSDINALLDDKLLVSSDVNSSKNDNKGKVASKRATKGGVNERRIIDLKIFINELAVLANNNGNEFDPFDLGCSKDMLLSEIKGWEKNRVSIKSEKIWAVGNFPKKVWEHGDRKNICDNFQNKNNTPDPDFFKKIYSK